MATLLMRSPLDRIDRHITTHNHSITYLWDAGWRITGYVHNSLEDLNQYNDWISRERDYLARRQRQTTTTHNDSPITLETLATQADLSLSVLCGIELDKAGDSQKTPLTSSKGKNTFKAFIQRTTNTV